MIVWSDNHRMLSGWNLCQIPLLLSSTLLTKLSAGGVRNEEWAKGNMEIRLQYVYNEEPLIPEYWTHTVEFMHSFFHIHTQSSHRLSAFSLRDILEWSHSGVRSIKPTPHPLPYFFGYCVFASFLFVLLSTVLILFSLLPSTLTSPHPSLLHPLSSLDNFLNSSSTYTPHWLLYTPVKTNIRS